MPDDFEEHAKLMIDLQVIAFQTDMTRVITFMLGREGSNRPYREIGISDGHHSLTHHQNDPAKIDKVTKIDELHVSMFAYCLEQAESDARRRRHAARPFDDRRYGSSISDGNIHTHHDLPIVVAGAANGQLKGSRHLVYARKHR